MQMVWEIIKETVKQSFSIILPLAAVILVLMVGIELLRESGWMEKLTRRLSGAARLLGIPGEAMLGVVVGVFGGISYGTSIIYDISQTTKLNRTQLNTMFILIGICHSLIEETAVYAAAGANVIPLILARLLFGISLALVYRAAAGRRALAQNG